MSVSEDKTPGRQAIAVMQDINNEIIFKKPIGITRKKPKEKILDEDTYVEEIGKIIQRDFFPDLEKLKAQNEYLDAVERNDTTKMRELYMKYRENRPPVPRIPSPATFETPANIHNSQTPEPSVAPTIITEQIEHRLSLDQYLNSHTSQDNKSFTEILAESDKKHMEKYSYLYNEEEKCEEERRAQLALPTIEQQCALPVKKLNVDTWSYKNKNYIMYTPDGIGLTPSEEVELVARREEVVHANTRLTVNPFNESQSKETISELAKTQARVLDGKIGVDGKELMQGPGAGGFSFVTTPSPRPGVDSSPFMTWGEIEGTPFRLDGSDTPLPKSQGPSFKMAEPPRREQLALALAEKVRDRDRDRRKKAKDVARRQLASPSPARLATMSPAARRLATAKLGLGSELRLSYSPSPRATPSTPKRVVTPKLNLGIRKAGVDDHLTDDLLKIQVPKRQKASDFF